MTSIDGEHGTQIVQDSDLATYMVTLESMHASLTSIETSQHSICAEQSQILVSCINQMESIINHTLNRRAPKRLRPSDIIDIRKMYSLC
jgi:hypothetical protein